MVLPTTGWPNASGIVGRVPVDELPDAKVAKIEYRLLPDPCTEWTASGQSPNRWSSHTLSRLPSDTPTRTMLVHIAKSMRTTTAWRTNRRFTCGDHPTDSAIARRARKLPVQATCTAQLALPIELPTVLNLFLEFVPMRVTAAMQTTAMRATIR